MSTSTISKPKQTPVKKTAVTQKENIHSMRADSLESLGLGKVFSIFKNGKLPVSADEMVDKIFGKKGQRGAMIISGASGIVGAGKAMQFGSRLLPYGIPIVALDLPGAPDGISKQYKGLAKAFGRDGANDIMKNIIRLNYDGATLPEALKAYKPKYLLEAIPEKLDLKKAHYKLFKKQFPGIEIWSVTSGFPSSQLGVGIAHPAFPHEINKMFEIVEKSPSDATRLLWSLGLIPVQVSDHWSFVLDVFFCGLMLAGLRYHEKTNVPYWKADKYIRKLVGPNPFRAHDAIGAAGANFLTWSCLHHLAKEYGPLFEPNAALTEHKDSGQNWYPLDHFRPMVNWELSEKDQKTLEVMILGPIFQMTSIMIKENRSTLASMNLISELCAQFTKGIPAMMRAMGEKKIVSIVKEYHKLHPESAKTKWYPEVFKNMNTPEWQQLYVNAEHDGKTGVITISRESYNSDVDAELNRAIDFLKKAKINRVIVTGDFHMSTQLVGADTTEFFPALTQVKEGERIASTWSATARRLYTDFEVSVGFINGKRCMGGMLELMMHCHYLMADGDTTLSMPEVTIPVVPGMEGCHWALRKADAAGQKKLMNMLMTGKSVKAADAQGWLVDFAGNLDTVIKKAQLVMDKGTTALPLRKVNEKAMKIKISDAGIQANEDRTIETARKALADCITESCGATLADALKIQAKHSAAFMVTPACLYGRVGAEYSKITNV